MRTAIVYYSQHHGNTQKVLDAIAKAGPVDLIDAQNDAYADLSGYDLIGFASGIYYQKFHPSVLRWARERLPQGKKVFFLYTCGAKGAAYTAAMEKAVREKGGRIVGAYGCLGYDTFGPFKWIGGIAKGHPTQEECREAAAFFQGLLQGAGGPEDL